jgi:hypothetical protein
MARLQSYVKSLPHVDAMGVVDQLCETLHCPSVPSRSTLTWPVAQGAAEDASRSRRTRAPIPLLTRVTAAQVREEVARSRDELARETGQRLPAFAYSRRAYDRACGRRSSGMEGFQLAFTTVGGHNLLPSRDALELRRTNVTPKTSRARCCHAA